MHDDLDDANKMIGEMTAIIQRAIAFGRRLEKADMAERLGLTAVKAATTVTPGVHEHGWITNTLRRVFYHFGRSAEGINFASMRQHAQRETPSGMTLSESQARAGLTSLFEAGEVERVDRGMYRATKNLREP